MHDKKLVFIISTVASQKHYIQGGRDQVQVINYLQGSLLLPWIDFDPSMDE